MQIRANRFFVVLLSGISTLQLHAQAVGAPPVSVTLFENVRVLAKTGQLTSPTNVLVRGNVIAERISTVSRFRRDRSA